jgi:hypothetical protein
MDYNIGNGDTDEETYENNSPIFRKRWNAQKDLGLIPQQMSRMPEILTWAKNHAISATLFYLRILIFNRTK